MSTKPTKKTRKTTTTKPAKKTAKKKAPKKRGKTPARKTAKSAAPKKKAAKKTTKKAKKKTAKKKTTQKRVTSKAATKRGTAKSGAAKTSKQARKKSTKKKTVTKKKSAKKRAAKRETVTTAAKKRRSASDRRSGAATIDERVARSKFDLGLEGEPGRREPLPWGYAEDRIGAMGIDPERLFLYWEVTNEGIEAARRRLRGEPTEEGLCLRIYDTSGRIFDGTNAVSYVDIPVTRDARQWFLRVGKPGAAHVAEIGVRSRSGRFVRIARSKRLDFPRRTPAPSPEEDWMTVVWRPEGIVTVEHRPEGGPPAASGVGTKGTRVVRPAKGGELVARDPLDDIGAEEGTPDGRNSAGGASEQSSRARRPPWRESGQG